VSLYLAASALLQLVLQHQASQDRLGAMAWPMAILLVVGLACLGRGLVRLITSWHRGTLRVASGLPLRGWLYAMAGSCAVIVVLSERGDALLQSIVLGAGAAVFGVGFELAAALGPELPRPLRALDLLLFNLVLLCVVGELGLRALAVIRPTPLLCIDSVRSARRLASHRFAPAVLRFGFPFNSLGHYDTELVRSHPSQKVVLCIGDSFSVGVVPHHYHFTTVAERRLEGVQLYNMGVPAADPPEYLHLLVTQGLALEPDLLVVNVFVGNDFVFQLERRDRAGEASAWLGRDRLLLYQVPRRLAALASERRRLRPLPGRAHRGPARRVSALDELEQLFPFLLDPALEEPTMSDDKFMEIEVARAKFQSRLPEEDFLSAFEVLAEIRRASGATPMLVMIIPDQFQVDDGLWSKVQSAAAMPLRRDRCQHLLRRWLEEQGIRYLDLLPVLRAVPPLADGSRHLYHRADTHFNARGNQVAGEALAEFLAPHLDRSVTRRR
jgi:lysophospholipase L1-like esterase